MEDSRFVSPDPKEEDHKEFSLRPKQLSEFIGQEKIRKNLSIVIQAAQKREESLDHLLVYGPPGLGKTTLANIVAAEMQVNIKITSGPAIERPGDLAAILTGLEAGDVLFIDEIHRLNRSVEEVLYPAMEDFELDIVIGKGPSARSIRLNLERFTMIGATTRVGLLSAPLRDRFGILERVEFYTVEELQKVIERAAAVLKIDMVPDASSLIASRSRGTPRIANRLLKRVRDWAQVQGDNIITPEIVSETMSQLGVDELGLDHVDQLYLKTIIEKFSGGPVGVDTVSASMSEDSDTLEDVVEPYLLQLGFIDRTPRGRLISKRGYDHLGIPYVNKLESSFQSTLFNQEATNE